MRVIANNIFLVIVCGVLIAAAVIGYGRYTQVADQGPPRSRGPVPVVVTPVTTRTFSDKIEALGTARANESVVITAQVTETVRAVGFEDGQEVEAGAVLVQLTSDEEAAEFEEAQASLRQANQQFERISGLVERRNASQSALDDAVSARDQARARLRAIEARVDDRLVRAPFSGVLGLRQVSPGTLVTPGTVITTLDDVDPIKLDFSVPETFFSAVRPGLDVTSRSDAYPGETFQGKINVVDTRIDPETRSVLVRTLIANEDRRLRPGMLMRVDIFKDERESLMVPESAIVPLGRQVFVYRLGAENTVQRIEITIGAREPGAVEVTGGLDLGDQVVSTGTNRVRPGSAVRVVDE